MKTLLLISLLILSTANVFSQTEKAFHINHVFALDFSVSLKSRHVHNVVKACWYYIQKFAPKNNVPYIFLDLDESHDSAYYLLGYDNMYGSSVNNDIYKPKTGYGKVLGIRIEMSDTTINISNILKLLEYGITHLKELKKAREKAIKLGFYDRPHRITLKAKKIHRILNKPESLKVKSILNNSCL